MKSFNIIFLLNLIIKIIKLKKYNYFTNNNY